MTHFALRILRKEHKQVGKDNGKLLRGKNVGDKGNKNTFYETPSLL